MTKFGESTLATALPVLSTASKIALKRNKQTLLVGFMHNLTVADEVISAIVNLYIDLGDSAIKAAVVEGVLLFVREFGSRPVHVIAATLMQIEIDVYTVASCHHIFLLVNDLLSLIPSLLESIASTDRIISQVSQCLCVPYEETRIVLLEVGIKFVNHCVQTTDSLQLCCSLANPVVTLLSNCDTANVLLYVIQVIMECAKADDFGQWLQVANENSECGESVKKQIDKLFAHVKRCFMMQVGTLNTSLVKLILLFISKHHLHEPLLDSDLMGFVFDALKGTTSTALIQSVYDCILELSEEPLFYTSLHAVYGLASICKSLSEVLKNTAWHVVCSGFDVIQNLLKRSPPDIPLLNTSAAFDQLYQVVLNSLSCSCGTVVCKSLQTAPFLMIKSHLPHPPPFRDFTLLVEKVEQVLPQWLQDNNVHDSQIDIFTQSVAENPVTLAENVFLNLFEFFGQCMSLLSSESNQQEMDDFEMRFMEKLHSTLTKKWIPRVLDDASILGNPDISFVFFDIVVKGFQCLNNGDGLFGCLVANKFLHLTLSISTKVPCRSIQQCICTFCFHFLQNLGLNDSMLQHLQQGFPNFKGQPCDILYMLKEFPLTESLCPDVNVSVVVCVVTSLAMACWFDQCLKESLIFLLSKDRSLSSLPVATRCLVLFLVCFVQQEESHPDLPNELVESLKISSALYLPHPVIITCLLQVDDEALPRDEKITMVKQWLSETGDVTPNFHTHPAARHLMGLMLLNNNVALLIMDAFASCADETESRKIVLLLSGAITESSSGESTESSPPELVTCLCRHLPNLALKLLTMENLKQAPTFVASSLFELLTVVIETNSLDDVTVHNILRKALSLVCDAYSDVEVSDVITASLIYLVEQMLQALSQPSDVLIVLSHTRFLPALQRSLNENIVTSSPKEPRYVLSFEIQLVALLVAMVSNTGSKVPCRLHVKVEDMLKFSMGAQSIECAMLKLWTSLYECGFKSELLTVEGTKPDESRAELTSSVDAMLTPLSHDETVALYVAALNATVKGFPGIRLSALRCVKAMLAYVAQATKDDPDVFQDLGNSPWLKLAVEVNLDEKEREIVDVCEDIRDVCETTFNKMSA